ncbi:MAG: SDR family oxidoreductase, partial [Myxococcota bacterium]
MSGDHESLEALSGWALILGASSGIGAATAKELARRGMNILGVHLDRRSTQASAEHVKAEIQAMGRQVELFNVNAADQEKRRQVVQHARQRLADNGGGPLRVLMHSLAFGTLVPFVGPSGGGVERRQMEMTLDVMAHSLVYWVQDLVEAGLLGEGSRVFAMTSEGSSRVWPGYGPVSAAKAALESHVRQLALELAPRGTTVNAILAGVTDTPALRKIPGHQQMMEAARGRNPHGRLTRPEDVAGA